MLFQDDLFLLAGPCALESYDLADEVSKHLKEICEPLKIKLIFKGSFDKANRSSIHSYRGLGLEKGLEILERIKKKYSLPVVSDVHTPAMITECKDILDIIQIPAFLARQTDFYIEAGKIGCSLNVKKGQFMSPYEIENVKDKFFNSGGKNLTITERGTFFGYGNLVVDFRSIKIIKDLSIPYIYDATHSLQLPAARKSSSGGQREFLEGMVFAQIVAGADGLFIEVHPNPDKAKSDSEVQYPLSKMKKLLENARKLYDFRKNQLNH